MKKLKLFLIVLICLFTNAKMYGQHELGLSRNAILALPWVKQYHQIKPYISALEYDFMRVTTNEYHYTFRFSQTSICVGQTLESRSFSSDIKLRDFLRNNGVPLSASTYIINSPNDSQRFYAFINVTHNGLPHQVIFSYEQMYNTDGLPSKDTRPYELNY